jgi:hypothetical protein
LLHRVTDENILIMTEVSCTTSINGSLLQWVNIWCSLQLPWQFSAKMSNYSAISWREHVIPWCFHFTILDFNRTSSMKSQYAGRCVAPLGHIILIRKPPVFVLTQFFQLMKSSPEYNNLQYGLACAMKWYDMYIIA